MVQNTGRPGYLQVADDLREQIRTGRLAAGDSLPSTARLAEQYDCSASVIKMAVSLLRAEGLLVGQQGKGVFVRDSAQPADALDAVRAELRDLSERVARLEQLMDDTEPPGGR